MGFSANQVKRLGMNGFAASLLPEADRARFMREIELLFCGA